MNATSTKKKFRVLIREVHVQPVDVEANTKEEALALVRDGDGDYDSRGAEFEYSHTLPPETWTVEEVPE